MPALELHQPFETTEPRLRVENILLPGRHRFRLIVVDDDGIESDPVDTLVTIVAPVARSDVAARAREARGRLFYATGVLLNAQHLDADQLDNHRWVARALAYRRRPEGPPGRDLCSGGGVARGRRLVRPGRPPTAPRTRPRTGSYVGVPRALGPPGHAAGQRRATDSHRSRGGGRQPEQAVRIPPCCARPVGRLVMLDASQSLDPTRNHRPSTPRRAASTNLSRRDRALHLAV